MLQKRAGSSAKVFGKNHVKLNFVFFIALSARFLGLSSDKIPNSFQLITNLVQVPEIEFSV